MGHIAVLQRHSHSQDVSLQAASTSRQVSEASHHVIPALFEFPQKMWNRDELMLCSLPKLGICEQNKLLVLFSALGLGSFLGSNICQKHLCLFPVTLEDEGSGQLTNVSAQPVI